MRILMMSNTYAPVIGGLEESIRSFSQEFRAQGHRVVIVAPTFEGMNENEKDVVRVPAIQNFLREGVSVTLPIPLFLSHFIKEFQPDIIHSHHFFWVGDMALRLARQHHIPLIFTYHIMLEHYADFLPIHNDRIKRFVLKLATGYANLTDAVIAPSRAVRDILRRDGVVRPVHIIPTGIDMKRFSQGNAEEFRERWTIPPNAFVAGFVGRLNPEKNLEFLARAAAVFLKRNRLAHCVIVGDGLMKETIKNILNDAGVADRLHMTGALQGQDLIDAYHAMDVFVFSSHSETQGLVLLESLASGTPVAAIDAPAVREIIKDRNNGRLLTVEDEEAFASGITWFAQLSETEWRRIRQNARATAGAFSMERSARRLLDLYRDLTLTNTLSRRKNTVWDAFKDSLKTEKDLLKNALEAGEAAVLKKTAPEEQS